MDTLVDIDAIYKAKVKVEDERLTIHIIGGYEALEWSLDFQTPLPDKGATWLNPKYPEQWKSVITEKLLELRTAIDEAIQRVSEIAKERREKYGCALFKKWESERRRDGSCD